MQKRWHVCVYLLNNARERPIRAERGMLGYAEQQMRLESPVSAQSLAFFVPRFPVVSWCIGLFARRLNHNCHRLSVRFRNRDAHARARTHTNTSERHKREKVRERESCESTHLKNMTLKVTHAHREVAAHC